MPKGKSHLGHAQMGYSSKKITFKKGLSVFLTFPFGVRDDLAVRGFRSEALGSEGKCHPGAPAVGEGGSQQAGWRMQPKASHVRELSQPGEAANTTSVMMNTKGRLLPSHQRERRHCFQRP